MQLFTQARRQVGRVVGLVARQKVQLVAHRFTQVAGLGDSGTDVSALCGGGDVVCGAGGHCCCHSGGCLRRCAGLWQAVVAGGPAFAAHPYAFLLHQQRQVTLQRSAGYAVAMLLEETVNAYLVGTGVDPFGELVQRLGRREAGHVRGS